MEEFELSEQCRLGNNRARKELYEHYGGRLLGVCLRYTGDRDTAQDLLHDGFIKIFSSFDKFTWRGEGSLRAWMERVMVNTALQYLRKKELHGFLIENQSVYAFGRSTRRLRGTRRFGCRDDSASGIDAIYRRVAGRIPYRVQPLHLRGKIA